MVTREQIRVRLRGYSFGGMPRRSLFFKPTESVCLCVCVSVCPELGLATFLQPARRLPCAFFELVVPPLRVGCMYHQRVECESVVPPPEGRRPRRAILACVLTPLCFRPLSGCRLVGQRWTIQSIMSGWITGYRTRRTGSILKSLRIFCNSTLSIFASPAQARVE